jgi:hypothetical protein
LSAAFEVGFAPSRRNGARENNGAPKGEQAISRQKPQNEVDVVRSMAIALAAPLYPSFPGSSFFEAGMDPAIYMSLFPAMKTCDQIQLQMRRT